MLTVPKTLLVVYKDPLALNLLRKLVETSDDDVKNNITVGTKDGSVKIRSFTEKQWRASEIGEMDDKVLFIGNIKEAETLAPIIDYKYNKYGIKYGWAGDQALIQVDENYISPSDYAEFRYEYDKKFPQDKHRAKSTLNRTPYNSHTGVIKAASYLVDHFYINRPKFRQQRLLFGIKTMYEDDLEKFMNS